MTKEARMLITQLKDGMWQVEVWDKYGDYRKVFNDTIDQCREYALDFQKGADERNECNEMIGELVKKDRKAGRNWEQYESYNNTNG